MNNDQLIEQQSDADKQCSHCEALVKQCEEYRLGWQRAVADYQNLQKEVSRARGEWATMSELVILEEFLPIYTNFKMAFGDKHVSTEHVSTEQKNWVKGIEFIMKQFGDILRSHGIEEIKTVGELFDAARHEAVGEEVSEQPEHTIVREVETGFTMKGKVIKVAKVVVAA